MVYSVVSQKMGVKGDSLERPKGKNHLFLSAFSDLQPGPCRIVTLKSKQESLIFNVDIQQKPPPGFKGMAYLQPGPRQIPPKYGFS